MAFCCEILAGMLIQHSKTLCFDQTYDVSEDYQKNINRVSEHAELLVPEAVATYMKTQTLTFRHPTTFLPLTSLHAMYAAKYSPTTIPASNKSFCFS
jgi:hypothetical protein